MSGRSDERNFRPPTRFSRLLLKVNAFLLIALLLVASFIGLVAYKQGWFVHQTEIHFVTANALGLTKGMPVKLYGFTVGSVSGMELSEEGVDVRLSIMSEYMHRIPKGSLAKHSREAGVVGAAVIDIVPGKPGPALAHGRAHRLPAEPQHRRVHRRHPPQAVPAVQRAEAGPERFQGSGGTSRQLSSLRKEAEALPETHAELRKLIVSAEQRRGRFNKQNATWQSPSARCRASSAPCPSHHQARQRHRVDRQRAQQLRATARKRRAPSSARGRCSSAATRWRADAGDVFNAAKRSGRSAIRSPRRSTASCRSTASTRAARRPSIESTASRRAAGAGRGCGGTKAPPAPAQTSSQSQSRLADASSARRC
jgi:hypothetical protein